MAGTRPEALATAKVVPRLISEQSVPSSEHAVLNDKTVRTAPRSVCGSQESRRPSRGVHHGAWSIPAEKALAT